MTFANIVFATWSRPVSNVDTLQMYWLCECGADGLGPAHHATQCANPDLAVTNVATIPGLWAQAVDHLADAHQTR